jgi:hypothetical protein
MRFFFVIKYYSEDDVHKSIKYNVWESTPNGNKILVVEHQVVKERSSGNPGSCLVFLFFSVSIICALIIFGGGGFGGGLVH